MKLTEVKTFRPETIDHSMTIAELDNFLSEQKFRYLEFATLGDCMRMYSTVLKYVNNFQNTPQVIIGPNYLSTIAQEIIQNGLKIKLDVLAVQDALLDAGVL